MNRNKIVILVSHCILNQNSVIRDWERAKGGFNNLVIPILNKNYGIIQMPCPEFSFLGEDRPPMSKDDYNTPAYRKHCKKLAYQVLMQAKEYIKHDYVLCGMVGIEESPTCDTTTKQGIFQEELNQLFTEHNIQVKTIDVPPSYIEGKTSDFITKYTKWLNQTPNYDKMNDYR